LLYTHSTRLRGHGVSATEALARSGEERTL
jgi:hypothetical protein